MPSTCPTPRRSMFLPQSSTILWSKALRLLFFAKPLKGTIYPCAPVSTTTLVVVGCSSWIVSARKPYRVIGRHLGCNSRRFKPPLAVSCSRPWRRSRPLRNWQSRSTNENNEADGMYSYFKASVPRRVLTIQHSRKSKVPVLLYSILSSEQSFQSW